MTVSQENSIHLLCTGKCHCTADLLVYLFGVSCFAYCELATDLLILQNPNQSNRRSAIQWYFPIQSKWFVNWEKISCFTRPADEVMNLLNEAVEAHFKSVRGVAFGFDYLTVLNPDYVTTLVKEYLIYAPNTPAQQGNAVPPGRPQQCHRDRSKNRDGLIKKSLDKLNRLSWC